MRLLWSYLERTGVRSASTPTRPVCFRPRRRSPRDLKELPRDEREPLPPTQIGRALAELGIVWIAAHSPQAKGRVEREFSDGPGPSGERLACGGSQDPGASQCLSGNRVSSLVEPDPDGGAGHRRRCTPSARQGPLASSFVELRRNQGGGQRLHDSVRPQDLSDRPPPIFVLACAELRCGSRSGWMGRWPCVSATATWQ